MGQNNLLYCRLYKAIKPQEMRNAGVLQDNCQAGVLVSHRITEMEILVKSIRHLSFRKEIRGIRNDRSPETISFGGCFYFNFFGLQIIIFSKMT